MSCFLSYILNCLPCFSGCFNAPTHWTDSKQIDGSNVCNCVSTSNVQQYISEKVPHSKLATQNHKHYFYTQILIEYYHVKPVCDALPSSNFYLVKRKWHSLSPSFSLTCKGKSYIFPTFYKNDFNRIFFQPVLCYILFPLIK